MWSLPCVDLFLLIALGGADEPQRKGERRGQQPISIPEWYSTSPLMNSSCFVWNCPSFSSESPQSLVNQDGWLL